MFDRIKIWARVLKRDAYAVYLAARDPKTPWYVKVLAAVVAAYAFSPSISFRISFPYSDIWMI